MFEPVCAVFIPVTVFIVAVRVAPLLHSGLAHTHTQHHQHKGRMKTDRLVDQPRAASEEAGVCVSVCSCAQRKVNCHFKPPRVPWEQHHKDTAMG